MNISFDIFFVFNLRLLSNSEVNILVADVDLLKILCSV